MTFGASCRRRRTRYCVQLTNFARHAQVASLMLPSETALPPAKTSASRDQLLKRVMKSVCKVETE